MWNNLFTKKNRIEEYYIADTIVVGGNDTQSYDVIKRNRLIKVNPKNKALYQDLYTGFIHEGIKGDYSVTGKKYMWITYFKINELLVSYFPGLINKKITDDEAKRLYVMIPRIKSLIEKGYTIDEITPLLSLSEIKKNNSNKKHVKKLNIKN